MKNISWKNPKGLLDGLLASMAGRIAFKQVIPSVAAGFVSGMIDISFEISFAALIFSGPLAGQVNRGIGLTLFGAVIISTVVALFSSFKGTIAIPQDSPAAILALVAAAIVTNMGVTQMENQTFYTVVAAIAMTTCITGAILLAFGWFKLGRLMRFIPYPVVGGFLAGTGWLLVQGAISVMAGTPLGLTHLGYLFDTRVLVQWIPGAILAILMFLILRRNNSFFIMPLLIVGSIVLFYSVMLSAHTSIAEASAQGWLLGPFSQEGLWQPLNPGVLALVNWKVIFGQMDKIGTIAFISAIALLLNTTALELAIRQDIDLNRELKVAGIANLLAGLGGSPVGYHALSLSTLAHRIGGRSRLVGLTVAVFCGGMLFFGASLLSYFPKVVLGGLLFFLGLSFLVEWVYDAWFRLPRIDYGLVILILAIIGFAGFLEGVAAGIAISMILFVINYSRINVIRHSLTGANFHSTVDRSVAQRQLLSSMAEQLKIYQLQGYIFFGTAQSLLNEIRSQIMNSDLAPLRFLVLDFTRVPDLDSSASSSFVRMNQLTETKNIQLIFTHLTSQMQYQLEQAGLIFSSTGHTQFFPTLDNGLEWCEDQILIEKGYDVCEIPASLEKQLEQIFTNQADVERFLGYVEKEQVDSGRSIIHQGDSSDCLYFIESGLITTVLELPDGRNIRLRKMTGGTTIGETGLYLRKERTASVTTVQPCTLYRLSAEAIRKMESEDPELAAAFHKWIACLMAERLADTNNTIAALMD
jgi:SulP family sulfate permease